MAHCSSAGISEDEAVSHRLYDMEVIELSEDVSFILLMPPVEGVCSVPGHQEDDAAQNALQCISLPVQVFEMSECPSVAHFPGFFFQNYNS